MLWVLQKHFRGCMSSQNYDSIWDGTVSYISQHYQALIRHRVFITKLAQGAEEEYKARHDALVEARGDQVTLGPDSNFSIWSAGGYIFGYDEIDTSMECDKTEESAGIHRIIKRL